MFTGIIEHIGIVKDCILTDDVYILSIICSTLKDERLCNGDSLSINGVCLTIINISKIEDNLLYMFHVTQYTMSISNLNVLKNNISKIEDNLYVNIEIPLTLNKFISGHIVYGHIDTVAYIKKIATHNSSDCIVTINIRNDFRKYIRAKNSITIDGVSLTIVESNNISFVVNIIPATYQNTIFKYYKIDTIVNIEFDYIVKNLEHMLVK